MRLGTSQKAVLDWLKEHPRSKAQEVGDALYDKVSMCAGWKTDTAKPRLRAQWASRLLQKLKKLDLVTFSDINDPKWSVKEE
jgi:hypothetical protein